jgi:hypothetical protein
MSRPRAKADLPGVGLVTEILLSEEHNRNVKQFLYSHPFLCQGAESVALVCW